MDERRTEPRYLVNEDALVWDLHRTKAGGCHLACITDVSRNGMRLESGDRLPQGSHIAIDFRGMIVCGAVQYLTGTRDRFAMGVRINEVLDAPGEEPEDRPADEHLDETAEAFAQAAVRVIRESNIRVML